MRCLVEDYPAHQFIIDRREAQGLFERVSSPKESLWDLILAIGQKVLLESDPCHVERLDGKQVKEESDDDGSAAASEGGNQVEAECKDGGESDSKGSKGSRKAKKLPSQDS